MIGGAAARPRAVRTVGAAVSRGAQLALQRYAMRRAARQALILPSKRGRSTGFVSKSAQPTAALFSRSLASACAVSAMTGMSAVSGARLISSVASQPSIAPSATSIRMRSGDWLAAMATPDGPSGAQQISNPLRLSRRVNMSRLISLSSTSRILGIDRRRNFLDRIGAPRRWPAGLRDQRQQPLIKGLRCAERGGDIGVLGRRRCGDSADGNSNGEATADIERALDRQFAAQQAADLATERQAESGPAIFARRRIAAEIETLEKPAKSVRRDADSRIAHTDRRLIALRSRDALADKRNAALASELDGVVDQLAERALQFGWVCLDDAELGTARNHEVKAVLPGERSMALADALNQRLQVDRLGV